MTVIDLPTPITHPPLEPSLEPLLDDAERARRIRSAIRARSAEVRAAHPWLRHQSAIGAGLLALAALGVLAGAGAYLAGIAAWWVVVPWSAFWMSVAHEIEHDTIHRQYFPRNARAQSTMLGIGWALRPYTISPWMRRDLHLLHHKVSGTSADIEERAITNGQPWGPRRLVLMLDPLAAAMHRMSDDRSQRRGYLRLVRSAFAPLTFVALTIWYSFLVLSLLDLVAQVPTDGAAGALAGIVRALAIVWIAPNVLRIACLHLISSNMHYYGDIEDGNVIQQTQILDAWFLHPLQLFCMNFGSTHGIHHFVPADPFYVRQATARAAHAAMLEHGVRRNDLGTFRRANRWR